MQCSYRDNPFYVIILRFLFQRNPNTIMNISPHVTKKAEENAADKFAERFNFWFSNEWNSKWNSLRYFWKNKKARKGFAQPFLAYIWCFILQTLPSHTQSVCSTRLHTPSEVLWWMALRSPWRSFRSLGTRWGHGSSGSTVALRRFWKLSLRAPGRLCRYS